MSKKNYQPPSGRTFLYLILGTLLAFTACKKEDDHDLVELYTVDNAGLPSNDVTALVYIDTNKIFIGTSQGCVYYNGVEWKKYNTTTGTLNNDKVTCMAISENEIKVGTAGGGLNRLNYLTTIDAISSATHYNTVQSEIVSDTVVSLLIDEEGNEWIGTDKGLSFHLGGEWANEGWTNYTAKNGFKLNKITAIEEDQSGNIWVGMQDKVMMLTDSSFAEPSLVKPFIPGDIHDMITDRDKRLWIAGNDSLYYLNMNQNHNTYSLTSFELMPRKLFIDFNQQLWIGTTEGLKIHIDNGEFITQNSQGIAGTTVQDILQAEDRSLWVATSEGLYKVIDF